jgi:pimeloyl-ACP methyl ester carboxylesterase
MNKHFILYIPGLGDHYDGGRSFALWFWRIYGFRVRLLPVKWYGGGSFEDKMLLVVSAVQEAQKQGYKVTLIGESAGASLALNAAAQFPRLHKIILIAGVNSSKLSISPHIQRRSPSFLASIKATTPSLTKVLPGKIHTVRALADGTVSPRFNDIPGAHRHVVWSVGHIPTILLCLTLLSLVIAKIIRGK